MPEGTDDNVDVARLYGHLSESACGEGDAEDADLRRFLRRIGLTGGRQGANAA